MCVWGNRHVQVYQYTTYSLVLLVDLLWWHDSSLVGDQIFIKGQIPAFKLSLALWLTTDYRGRKYINNEEINYIYMYSSLRTFVLVG